MSRRERVFHAAMVAACVGLSMMALNGDTPSGARWGVFGLVNAVFVAVQVIICQHVAWKQLRVMARKHAPTDHVVPLQSAWTTTFVAGLTVASAAAVACLGVARYPWFLALIPIAVGLTWVFSTALWVRETRRVAPYLPVPPAPIPLWTPLIAIGGLVVSAVLVPIAPRLALAAIVASCAALTDMVGIWLGWATMQERPAALDRFAAVFGWRGDRVAWWLAALTIVCLICSSLVTRGISGAIGRYRGNLGLLDILLAAFSDPVALWRPIAWHVTVIGLPFALLAWRGRPRWPLLVAPLVVAHCVWLLMPPYPALSTTQDVVRFAIGVIWMMLYWPIVWGGFAFLLRVFRSPAAAWVVGFGALATAVNPILSYLTSGLRYLAGVTDTLPTLTFHGYDFSTDATLIVTAVFTGLGLSVLHRVAESPLSSR